VIKLQPYQLALAVGMEEDPRVCTHAATGDDFANDVYGKTVVGSFHAGDNHATQVCVSSTNLCYFFLLVFKSLCQREFLSGNYPYSNHIVDL
jgi:hypothetical protein